MADILKPTVSVKAQDHEFIFRVPSPLEKARLGAREASIRKMIDPTGAGWARRSGPITSSAACSRMRGPSAR